MGGVRENDFPACEVKIFVAFSAGVTDGSISGVEPSHGLLIPCRTSTHIGSSAVTGSRPKPTFFLEEIYVLSVKKKLAMDFCKTKPMLSL